MFLDRFDRACPGAYHRLAAAFDLRPIGDREIVHVGLPLGLLADHLEEADASVLVPDAAAMAPARRLSYIGGRLCAAHALRTLGTHRSEVGRGSSGEPLWPDGVIGSIAHDSASAVCVAARLDTRRLLGVDIERVVDEEGVRDIAAVCLTRTEARRFAEADACPELHATLLFAAKEAYYKAVHPAVRRFVDFDEVEVDEVDWNRRAFRVVPVAAQDGSEALPRLNGRFDLRARSVLAQVSSQECRT
jgi:enterobactin synthetase component D